MIERSSAGLALRALIGPLSLSVFNQFVSGGTSLALNIYFVRAMTKEDFGIYGLCLAGSLFLSGIGSAFLLVRMVVELPRRAATARRAYAACVLRAVLLVSSVTLIVLIVVAFLGYLLLSPVKFSLLALAGACMAGMTGLLREFVLRYAYSVHKESWAVLINTAMAALLLAVVLALQAVNCQWTASQAIWLIAVGQLAAGLTGLLIIRVPLHNASVANAMREIVDAWRSGKWAIAANLSNWLRSQAYSVLSPALAGFGGLAKLNAVRLLIAPVTFLLPAIGQLMLPRISAIAATRTIAVPIVSITIAAGLSLISGAYIAALFYLIEPVSAVVLNDRYSEIEGLAGAWATYLSIQVCAVVAVLTLQALNQFRFLFVAGVGGTALTVLAIAPLFAFAGLEGIVYAMVLGELATLVAMVVKVRTLARVAQQ